MKRVPWGGAISSPLQYDGRPLGDEDHESSNRNSLHSNAIHNEDYIDRGADNNVGDVGTGTNGINVMVTLLKHYIFYYLMMRLRWIFCYKILIMTIKLFREKQA